VRWRQRTGKDCIRKGDAGHCGGGCHNDDDDDGGNSVSSGSSMR
jgi:hypothetical protein